MVEALEGSVETEQGDPKHSAADQPDDRGAPTERVYALEGAQAVIE